MISRFLSPPVEMIFFPRPFKYVFAAWFPRASEVVCFPWVLALVPSISEGLEFVILSKWEQ